MIKVGIIGTGRATSISKGHLNGFRYHDDVELIGIYDLSREAMEQWCEAFGVNKELCYDSAEKLIHDADIVSICTPNFTHAEYICKCLEENTGVICEKPISSTGADIPKIRGAMANTTAKSMVNLNYRYIPGIRMMHDYLASGKAGRVYMIRHNMGGSRLANESIGLEWRFVRAISGTGALGDFGSHALDLLRYILGTDQPVLEAPCLKQATFIRERAGKDGMRPVENDDCDMLLASLQGGGMYSLMLSRVGAVDSRLEVVAANAILSFRLAEPDRLYVQARQPGEGYGPMEAKLAENARPCWYNAPEAEVPYLACAESVSAFIDAYRAGKTMATGLDYGISILEETERLDKLAQEVR